MLRIIIVWFLVISVHLNLQAQEHPIIDSLKILYQKYTDSTKADIAFEIGKYYILFNKHPDSVKYYALEGLRLAEKFNKVNGPDRGYFLLGQMHWRQHEPADALKYFEKAHEILTERKNHRGIISSMNAIGAIYWEFGDFENAMAYYLDAIEYGESIGELNQIDAVYSNVGSILRTTGSYAEADKYFRKSLSITLQRDDPEAKLIAINTTLNMLNNMMYLERVDSAKYYLDQVIASSREAGYTEGLMRAMSHQANLALKEENYEYAVQRSMALLSKLQEQANPDIQLLFNAHRFIAKAYASLGNRTLANQHLQEVQLIGETYGLTYKYGALEVAVFVEKKFGNYRKTVELQEKYLELHDSMLNSEKQRTLQMLQSLYETEKKEREMAELSQQNEAQAFALSQRKTLTIAISLTALFSLIALYFFSQQRVLKAKQKFYQAEQRLLRLQMNPHFLFNALSSIQNFLFNQADLQKAIRYLSKFAQLMRQVLEYSRETYITLDDEIRTLENYLALQQLRYDHAFEYEITVEEGINRWDTLIPPILAQPFVENAIEHSQVHLIEAGKIKVNFSLDSDHLVLTVEDNGVGRANARPIASKKKHKSLATIITKDRIQMLKNLSRREFSFRIVDLPQKGTKIIFELPLLQTV